MIQPEQGADPLHPGSKRNEINRLGCESFTDLVSKFNPRQLTEILNTHKYLEGVSNVLIFIGTFLSLGSSVSFRLTQHPELLNFNSITFGALTLFGGYVGAVGIYNRNAFREGINIINSRLNQNNQSSTSL